MAEEAREEKEAGRADGTVKEENRMKRREEQKRKGTGACPGPPRDRAQLFSLLARAFRTCHEKSEMEQLFGRLTSRTLR